VPDGLVKEQFRLLHDDLLPVQPSGRANALLPRPAVVRIGP
jgi:hypothetical protein